MATKTITGPLPDDRAEPGWEVALLFPAQGEWSEDDYLWLTDHTRCLVEFTDGHIEVLPMPTDAHQRIVLGAATVPPLPGYATASWPPAVSVLKITANLRSMAIRSRN